MNAVIYLYSYHHGNTRKVAEAMANVLSAPIVELEDDGTARNSDTSGYDLIGFGAGIDRGKHYKQILDYAESLPQASGKKAFIFSTAGIYNEKKKLKDHAALRNILAARGFEIVGEFSCLGFDTIIGILKLFGGLNKGRPNAEDLERAKAFAVGLTK
ncbi:MAG: flavodoxin family protein [Clostridiales bacterium]|jgi:flavodoxin|nr:flavodoxin family protein [Clostridiales bacterium]